MTSLSDALGDYVETHHYLWSLCPVPHAAQLYREVGGFITVLDAWDLKEGSVRGLA